MINENLENDAEFKKCASCIGTSCGICISIICCICPIYVTGLVLNFQLKDNCKDGNGNFDGRIPLWILIISVAMLVSLIPLFPFYYKPVPCLRKFALFYLLLFACFQLGWAIYGILLYIGDAGESCSGDAQPLRTFTLVASIFLLLGCLSSPIGLRTIRNYDPNMNVFKKEFKKYEPIPEI